MQHIETRIGFEKLNSAKVELSTNLNSPSVRELIIFFDAMHVVNSITKKCGDIATVDDFAKIFEKRLCGLSQNFDQVRVVFDQYMEGITQLNC